MKVYCACCGRQVIQSNLIQSTKYYISSQYSKHNFGNTVICRECGEDLDENGNFPEEYGLF